MNAIDRGRILAAAQRRDAWVLRDLIADERSGDLRTLRANIDLINACITLELAARETLRNSYGLTRMRFGRPEDDR